MLQTLWHFSPLILAVLIGAGIGALFYAGISSYLNRKPVIGTPEAVRFVDMPTTQKTLEKAARTIAIPLGPFKVSFR